MFPMLLKPYQGNTVFHKLHREEDIKSKLSGKQPELLLIHFSKDGGGGGGGRGGLVWQPAVYLYQPFQNYPSDLRL